jgi:hypothetical protein
VTGRRLLLAALLIAALATLVPVTADARPTSSADRVQGAPTDSGEVGATLQECLGAHRRVQVLFLLDRSKSMKRTDGTFLRVDALEQLLNSFGTVGGKRSGGKLTVEAELATFAQDFAIAHPWAPLNEDTLRAFRTEAEKLRRSPDGTETDYYVAARGAADEFEARDGAATEPSCQVLVWLTDGGYQIRAKGSKAYAPGAEKGDGYRKEVVEAGRKKMCEAAVTDMRQSDVISFVLGLKVTDVTQSDDDVNAPDFLQALANGTGPYACGPAAPGQGRFLPVDDVDQLSRQFSVIACAVLGLACVGGDDASVEVPTDGAVEQLTFQGQARSAGVLRITPPEGEPVQIAIGAESRSGTAAGARWRSQLLSPNVSRVTFDLAPASVPGRWKGDVVGRNGAAVEKALARVEVTDGLRLEADPPKDFAFIIGEDATVPVHLEGADERPVPTEGLSPEIDTINSAVIRNPVTGEAEEATVDLEPDGSGSFGYHPTASTASNLRVSTVVERDFGRFHPSQDGRPARNAAVITVPLLKDARLPRILDDEVHLSSVSNGNKTAEGVLRVKGSPDADGRVCIEAAKLDERHPYGTTKVESQGTDCFEVPANEIVPVEVRLSQDGSADGRVAGTITVVSSADNGKVSQRADVPYSFHQTFVSACDFVLAFALVALLVLLALGALVLLSRIEARFAPENDLRAFTATVEGSAAGIVLAAGGTFAPTGKDFSFVYPSGSEFAVSTVGGDEGDDGGFIVHSRPKVWAMPEAEVRFEGATVFGSLGSTSIGGSPRGIVPHYLHDSWALALLDASREDEASPTVWSAELVMFIGTEDGSEQGRIDRMTAEIIQQTGSEDFRTAVDALVARSNEVTDDGDEDDDSSWWSSLRARLSVRGKGDENDGDNIDLDEEWVDEPGGGRPPTL